MNGKAGPASIETPNKLPKPQIKGSIATYPSAYGKNIDLVITVTPSGFTQEIVIRERPSADSKDLTFRIPVKLPKGQKFGTTAGKPALLNAKGRQTTNISSALIVDAAANTNPDTGKISSAPVEVEHSAAGDSAVVTADPQFLADPAVTYPVTVQTASETWTGTGVDGDTHVSNVRPDGNANDALPWSFAGRSHSGAQTHRAYYRFNIKGTPLEGGTVTNADLRLFNYNSSTCSNTDSPGIELRRITSNWSMQTLKWSSQPTSTIEGHVANKGSYGQSCPQGEGELYYSIEQIVQGWMNGTPDLGVVMKSPIETEASNWRSYRMYEYGGYDTYPATPRGPVLFIEYTPAAPKYESAIGITPLDPLPDDATFEEVMNAGTYYANAPVPPTLDGDAFRQVRADSKVNMLLDSTLGMQPPEEATVEEWANSLDPNNPPDAPTDPDPTPTPTPDCTAPAWVSGGWYEAGDKVTYQGHTWEALTSPALSAPAAGDDWKDLGECKAPPADTTPPKITDLRPADGLLGVSPNAKVVVTFDEPVKSADISLSRQDGTSYIVVPGSISISGNVATFTPSSPLSTQKKTYIARVTDAADLAGNVLDDDDIRQSTFMTGPITKLKAAAPVNAYEYRRVADETDCRTKARARGTAGGFYANTYNYCLVSWINGTVKNGKQPMAHWKARVTLLIHSYVGFQGATMTAARGYAGANSRDMKARLVFDEVNCFGAPEWCNPRLYFNLNVNGQCVSDHANGEMKALQSWKNTRTDITITSAPGTGRGTDLASQCGFWPAVKAPDSDEKGWKPMLTEGPGWFRCDSSTRIRFYESGCVVWTPKPVWVLDGNDALVTDTAAHINQALTDPQSTKPDAPAGKLKEIPGNYGEPTANPYCLDDAPSLCLTRTMDKTGLIATNRNAARSACRTVRGGSWRKPDSCDEYPFASTYQGVSRAGINYSVKILPLADNCAAGRRLGGFYAYNRVLDGDPFWVWAVKKGDAVPPGLEEDARQVPVELPPCDVVDDLEPTL